MKTLFVLAGGASSRFGSPKSRYELDGKPLASWVAASAQEAGLKPVLLVKDPGLADLGWPILKESDSERFYPLRAMAEALSTLSDGESALFCPCDMPFVRVESFQAIAKESAPCVAWDGVRLHPLFCQLSTAQAGELGAWVQREGSAKGFLATATRVLLPAAELRNINRPDDLVSV